jgi:hypothetical protein
MSEQIWDDFDCMMMLWAAELVPEGRERSSGLSEPLKETWKVASKHLACIYHISIDSCHPWKICVVLAEMFH